MLIMMMFVMMYMLSMLMILMLDDWFMMWIGLEINLFSFILFMYENKSCNSIESCLKYFIIQASGSGLMLGLMCMSNDISYVGMLILMFKMGGGIFYFWFPSVCMGLSWISCFFLLSIQKLIPFMLINVFNMINWIMLFMSIFSIVVGVCGSFNQKCLKQLLAYSSIHHMGWMMMCQIVDSGLWLFYLVLYTFMIFPVIIFFKNKKIENLNVIFKYENKYMFIFMLLSMGGIPPFLGFFLKWIGFFFIKEMVMGMVIFMIFMSIYMLYIYVRISYDLMLGSSVSLSWSKGLIMYQFKMSMDMYILFGMFLGMLFMVFFMF